MVRKIRLSRKRGYCRFIKNRKNVVQKCWNVFSVKLGSIGCKEVGNVRHEKRSLVCVDREYWK